MSLKNKTLTTLDLLMKSDKFSSSTINDYLK